MELGFFRVKRIRIPLLVGWLDSNYTNICYLLGLVPLLPIMHVTAFFAAFCSCHWPEDFAQNPALSASHPGLSGSVSCRSSPGAWGTISALLRCSFCLPCPGFPYLVSQCSCPSVSFHTACREEDAALSARHFILSVPSNSSDHAWKAISTQKESVGRSGEAEEWDGMYLPSSISHALFVCISKFMTQGDQALGLTDRACAHFIFSNSHITKYFGRPMELVIKRFHL